jgi:hypothetical protein
MVSLTPENQKAIQEVNKKFFEEVATGLWDKQNESAWKYAVEEKGMKEIKLSQEETSNWIALVKPIQDEYIASMKEKGLPGQEALDLVKSLAEKYNQQYK